MPTLGEINALGVQQAEELFARCCIAPTFCAVMAAARPFRDLSAVEAAADQATAGLDHENLLVGFSGHPRIGDRKPHSAWSSAEQSGVSQADIKILDDLRAANFAYEEKFNHVFLICATGKSAEYMLDECLRRIGNSPDVELEEAREQLRLINRIRVNKLLEES
ncbi:MAG: 2-oxo-4-hydroxy-4-carboxy-5-ureidoimidazoline decarboxylase [Actinobacteria bacterium]|nr:2-oxo-4-hydroxy-4-carboxy-5-ureidoimidazoline decarboxylase [Actinomycetota bacterium]